MARAMRGTKGTCRHCGRPVLFDKRDETPSWIGPGWFHSDTMENGCMIEENPFLSAAPKEWCTYNQNEGDHHCNRSIKHVDIEAGLYACGIHMRQEVARKEQEEYRIKAREASAARDEFREWEATVYKDMERQLRHYLGDEVFGDNHAADEFADTKRANKRFTVEWLDLHNAVVALVARMREEVGNDTGKDRDVQGRDNSKATGV